MATATITLALVGDIVPSRHITGGEDARRPAVAEAYQRIRAADIAFGDLEMPFSGGCDPPGKLLPFPPPPVLATDLRRLGFKVLGLANNHRLGHGFPAL